MKQIFFVTGLFLVSVHAGAQVFTGTGGTILNNGGQETVFNLNVANLSPAQIDSTFGITEVCFDITHPDVNELSVSLMSPSGKKIQLTGVLSCTGGNFSSTCLNNTAGTSITRGASPYSGTMVPVGNLGRFNSGVPGTGTWKLYVKDFVAGSNAGSLNSWSIKFGAAPPKPVRLLSSNLPIVFVNTGGTQPGETDVITELGIIDNGGARNNIGDPINHFNGKAAVHTRGSSSKMFEKPSLKVELRDASGLYDLEVPMLGMPAESDWVLTAGYSDKTFLRNPLSQHLYRKMGRYSPRTRFVELILNGEYFGVYTFMEQPKRGKDRVSVAKMTAMDNQFPYITGGYIVQINRTDDPGWYSLYPGISNSSSKFYYQYNYPRSEEISEQQKGYIKAVLDSFETAMASPTFADPKTGYRKYINDDTFIDFLIINEFSRNPDAYKLSTYLFKDNTMNGGKVSVGPVWDYDIAWHNCNFGDAFNEKYWQYQNTNNEYPIPTWWKQLMTDKAFQDKLYCRYHTLRKGLLSNNEIYAYIDESSQLLAESQQRNFRQFPIMGAYIYPNPQQQDGATYQKEIADLKDWVQKRGAWLDANVPGYCATVSLDEQVVEATGLNAFPNPFSGTLKVIYTTGESGVTRIRMLDVTGAEVYSETRPASASGEGSADLRVSSLPPGVYILQISSDNVTRQVRVMKTAP
jgi:hypothetical protein